jgi:hypothetical protein
MLTLLLLYKCLHGSSGCTCTAAAAAAATLAIAAIATTITVPQTATDTLLRLQYQLLQQVRAVQLYKLL